MKEIRTSCGEIGQVELLQMGKVGAVRKRKILTTSPKCNWEGKEKGKGQGKMKIKEDTTRHIKNAGSRNSNSQGKRLTEKEVERGQLERKVQPLKNGTKKTQWKRRGGEGGEHDQHSTHTKS